jgi:PAS domain S-box-containing protein
MFHRNALPYRPQGNDQILRALFDNSRAAFFLKDLEGRYVLVNRRCLELLRDPEEPDYGSVLGKTDLELFSRSRADALRALDRRVIRTASSVEAEQEIFTGFEQRIYRIIEWPVFDQAGKVRNVCGLAIDITDLKRVEAELRKPRPGFEALVDSIDGIVWEVEVATSRFAYVSPQAQRLLGYPLDAWFATPNAWAKHLHPEDREAALALHRPEARPDRHHSLHYRMIAADGRVVWLHDIVTVIVNEWGDPVALRGVMVDVTEAGQTEERLRDSEQRLKEALRMGSMGYWELDVATLETRWSEEMFLLFERDLQAGSPRLDEGLNDYVSPEDRPRVAETVKQAIETGEPITALDARVVLPSRRMAYFATTIRPIRDAGGRVLKLTGVVQDITERKTTEQRLRDSERRLELALAGADLYLWELDLRSWRVDYSTDFPAFLGYDAESLEPAAEAWAKKLHPEDLPAAMDAWQAHIVGRSAAYQAEFRVRTQQGEWKWLHVRGQVVERDQQGQPLRVAGTVLDITAHKEAESVVRESEERFRTTFEQSAVGMAHFSPDGHCLRTNRKFADMLGYAPEELVGMHFSGVTHPDDVSRVAGVLQRMANGELDAFQLEKRYLRKDGVAIWGQTTISTMRGEKGGTQLFNVVCNDITERKEHERRLQDMQGQLEAATAIAQVGFWEVDLRTDEVYLSREWKRHLGYESWELPNRYEEWASRVHPEDWETVFAQRKQAIDEPWLDHPPFEYRLRHKDGSYRTILSRIVPRVDDKGEVVKLTGTHLDISERQQAEAERRARLAAEAANLAKSEFLANMSHELRSPLNTILGFARLMTSDPELPVTARDNIELILNSGQHLYALVNQVLDLSKLEAGRATFNEADFDLHLLLDDLRSLFAHAASNKGLQLLFACGRKVPRHVRSDALKLRQVLINLLDNAIKFTGKGRVSVTADVPAAGQQALAENDVVQLTFTVADSGPGIASDELPHLFGAFVQAEAGRQELHGSGLGLAISRGFVRLLGGEMTLESEIDKGTTVRFEIPVRIVSEKAIAAEAKFRRVLGLAQSQARYRILVVDTQAEARESVVRLLAPLGFEVRESADGLEAIEAWQRWRPHLIWMDLALPVLDGFEVTRRIRAAPRGRSIVVIAVTPNVDEAERGKVLAAGCDDLVRKPLREADVFAALEKYLQVHFVYEEDIPATTQPLDPQTLAQLPEEKRTALEDALVRLDADVVERTIDDIRDCDADIADALAACARDFQYESILSALHGEAAYRAHRPTPRP